MIHGFLKEVQRVLKGSLKVIRRFEEVSKKVLVCFKKLSKKASRVFQECFNEAFFDKFVVAWISSELPSRGRACFRRKSKY